MVRQLYRFYLYAVYIALLVFWAFGTGSFLNTLFKLTPLRSPYQEPPPHADVVQSLVFAVTTWLVAGALGGLHYWLIRRDLRSDPAATTSAIRSLFLNIPEALAVLFTVVLLGYGVINEIGHSGVSDSLAAALPALVIVVLLELERRRTPVTSGAALNLQRLHFYAVQLLFLFFIASQWFSAFRPLVDSWLFGARGIHEACSTGVLLPNLLPGQPGGKFALVYRLVAGL